MTAATFIATEFQTFDAAWAAYEAYSALADETTERMMTCPETELGEMIEYRGLCRQWASWANGEACALTLRR